MTNGILFPMIPTVLTIVCETVVLVMTIKVAARLFLNKF
jgi:hypothetical protein